MPILQMRKSRLIKVANGQTSCLTLHPSRLPWPLQASICPTGGQLCKCRGNVGFEADRTREPKSCYLPHISLSFFWGVVVVALDQEALFTQ